MNTEEIEKAIKTMLGRIEENVLTAEKNRAYNLGKIDAYNDCIGRLGVVLGKLKEGEQNNEQAQTH